MEMAAEAATHESTVDVSGACYAVVTNRSRDGDGLVASNETIAVLTCQRCHCSPSPTIRPAR